MDNGNAVSLIAGVAIGLAFGQSDNSSPVITDPKIVTLNHSFPDIWKAIYVDSDPSLNEMSNLLSYRFIHSYIANSLSKMQSLNSGFSHKRQLIKECFDRLQCNAMGSSFLSKGQGVHTILEFETLQSNSKVCLINVALTSNSSGFLVSPLGGSGLVESADINVPLRNRQRQFYLKERLNSYIKDDFIDLKKSGLINFPEDDPLFLKKLGNLMALVYGKGKIQQFDKLTAVYDALDYASIYSEADGSGAFVHLQRKDEFSKYSNFINHITDIYYE